MYIKADIDFYMIELQKTLDYKTTISHIIDGQPTGNVKGKPEDKWIELMEYAEEIVEYLKRQIKNLQHELMRFELAVDMLPARERSVLKGRYLACLPFTEVLRRTNFSERTMYRAHNDGIKHLDMSILDD